MKMYTHKSGQYVATERSVSVLVSVHSNKTRTITKYEMTNLKDITSVIVDPNLIENSNDWTPMFDTALQPVWTERAITLAFRQFLAGITVHGKPISYPKSLRFEEIFFQLLLEQKK
jgi:hypothetical protein